MNFSIILLITFGAHFTDSRSAVIIPSQYIEKLRKFRKSNQDAEIFNSLVVNPSSQVPFKRSSPDIEERKLRLIYQAMLDLGGLIKAIVDECYPRWGKHRQKEDYSETVWRTVFLNLEHPRVLNMLSHLEENNFPEDHFITEVNKYLEIRNRERKPAYPLLLGITISEQKVIIGAILSYSYSVDNCTVSTLEDTVPKFSIHIPLEKTTLGTQRKEACRRVLDKKQAARNNIYKLNLLEVSFAKRWSLDEFNFEKELHNVVAESSVLGCLVVDGKALTLFDTFESALKAMEHFETIYPLPDMNFTIGNVNDFSLLKNQKKTALKVESSVRLTADGDLENLVRPIVSDNVMKTKRKLTNDINIMFLIPESVHDCLTSYQKIKKKLISKVAVSVISETSINKP